MRISRSVHILLVEDNPNDTLRIIRALGTECSRNFHAVEDGTEALAYLRQEGIYWRAPQPDIVLIDLDLVRRDSRQVLAAIRADGRLRAIPVVILMPANSQHDSLRRYARYVSALIPKSFTLEQFTQMLQGVVSSAPADTRHLPQEPPDVCAQSRN